jgi:hypothetical protein
MSFDPGTKKEATKQGDARRDLRCGTKVLTWLHENAGKCGSGGFLLRDKRFIIVNYLCYVYQLFVYCPCVKIYVVFGFCTHPSRDPFMDRALLSVCWPIQGEFKLVARVSLARDSPSQSKTSLRTSQYRLTCDISRDASEFNAVRRGITRDEYPLHVSIG